jgi:hypothetical protein
MSDQIVDMVLHDGSQRCSCPSTRGNPARQLADPDKIVAANLLSVGFCEIQDYVASCVVENILFGFGVLELLSVRGYSIFFFKI